MTLIQVFTLNQAARLAAASEWQLAYWASSGVLAPSVLYDRTRRPTRYLYSFSDLVGLRVISLLRNEHGLSLQRLRKAGKVLREHADRPWSELTFWVRGKELFFQDPLSDQLISADDRRQATAKIEVSKVVTSLRRSVEKLNQRDPADIGKVERRRNIQHNRPVVKGTRVPVSSILDLAAAGSSIDDIVEAYPSVTHEDVKALLTSSAQVA